MSKIIFAHMQFYFLDAFNAVLRDALPRDFYVCLVGFFSPKNRSLPGGLLLSFPANLAPGKCPAPLPDG